ncbi:MAG: dihydrodipicolinate synthase family protein [Burkholderiaceae bacterium]
MSVASGAGAARWHGVFPMMYAFFDDKGALDRQAFRRQIEWCIARQVHGIALLGLITEVSALSVRERETLVEWAVQDIARRVPLAVTIAGRDIAEQVRALTHAQQAGADCLVLQPPLGSRPDGATLTTFFSQVMQAASVPVGIQNAPEYLGVGLDANQVLTLQSRHPLFELMKGEGPLAQVRPFIEALAGSLAVFNGRGGLELTDNLRAGCAGMIPAPIVPPTGRCRFTRRTAMATRHGPTPVRLLPYVVFAMQSLDAGDLYGAVSSRGPVWPTMAAASALALRPEQFLEQTLARHLARLGDFPPAGRAGGASPADCLSDGNCIGRHNRMPAPRKLVMTAPPPATFYQASSHTAEDSVGYPMKRIPISIVGQAWTANSSNMT